eukprot:CAMPEP_0118659890 /NCGR_PEP_ID=MMETSP0785-20121206/15364_1 /TAXON_ID=91992 /ORGANISM="Bolidomonas pacifica, Strain CCMP 1866" /LENGTH=911 /DNA_ID=CAMNT_0006553047 /DNA_START=180 /DNA_END=2911 /DNA_ORIENTATION=-
MGGNAGRNGSSGGIRRSKSVERLVETGSDGMTRWDVDGEMSSPDDTPKAPLHVVIHPHYPTFPIRAGVQAGNETMDESGQASPTLERVIPSLPPPSPMGPVPYTGTNAKAMNVVHNEETQQRGEDATLKCVYNYEDRFRFSRILSHDSIIFDSHFECGNLSMANRVSYEDIRDKNPSWQEYDLELSHDINSKGFNQWFYFSCSNVRKGVRVKFNITNLGKPSSLFNSGMKPLMYSQNLATMGIGWIRTGDNIKYFNNDKKAPKGKGREGAKRYYTLTWETEFKTDSDVVFFAMCYPYSYSSLQRYLFNLQSDASRNHNFRRELLCETLAGNRCDLLTITEETDDLQALASRKGVVLTARVHPGESNASWIMKGLIDYLTSNVEGAKDLRRRYVFKVVPMLNPDGVINGNYRCSLAGVDLNRRWDKPDRYLHPTITSCKAMVRRFCKTRDVVVQCDIHGHSRKEGVFMYGCVPDRGWKRWVEDEERKKMEAEYKEAGGRGSKVEVGFGGAFKEQEGKRSRPGSSTQGEKGGRGRGLSIETGLYKERDSIHKKIRARLLPRILDGKSEAFTLSGCSFKLSPSKASTMRVVMYHEMNITCAYTLEASFGGKDGVHYGVGDLEEVGWEFAESLREFWKYLKDEDGAVTGVKRSLGSKEEGEKVGFGVESDGEGEVEVDESVRKYIEAEYVRVQRAEEEEVESAGSESDPSADNMDEDERRKRLGKKKKGKKKITKTATKAKKVSGRVRGREAAGGLFGGGSRERVGSANNRVPKIPVGEVFREPKRPEGRKTRRSFENLASRTPRASITKEKADKNEQNVVRPRRAVSAGGVGSTRLRRRRTESEKKEVDPRFVTVGGNSVSIGSSNPKPAGQAWKGTIMGVGGMAAEIEQAVKAGIGPRVGGKSGSVRKVKKDL